MAEIKTYKCDECGAVKAEVNHWWRFFYDAGQITILPWISTGPHAAREFDKHLCGRECVIKAVSKALMWSGVPLAGNYPADIQKE